MGNHWKFLQTSSLNSLITLPLLSKNITFNLSQTINMEMAAEKLVMRIRLQAFTNILTQPMAWFDFNKNSVGNLITKLDRDAPLIKGVKI